MSFRTMAQEDSASSGSKGASTNAAKAAQFAADEAIRYSIRPAKSGDEFELVSRPVLRWSNPTDGEVHGSVVFWTNKGCPEAAASIYRFFDREQINVELVTLSESPLKVTRNDRVRWTPDTGVKFKAVADAPTPADNPAKHQLQLKALSRRFVGALAGRGDDATFSPLRLMDRPLYQYTSSDGVERRGAVFALVNTTDPEILLILESRRTANGREWLYAAARMHFCRLQLKLDDKTVWEVPQAAPPWEKIRGPEGSYVILEWPSAEAAVND